MVPSSMVDVREYLDTAGRSPFAAWFERLNAPAAAKVAIAVTRIGQGNFSNVKGVSSGVYEYTIDFGSRLPDLLRQGWRSAGDPSRRRNKKAPPAGHRHGHRILAGLQAAKAVGGEMALTRDFKQTVQARVKRDSAFRKALLREAIESFLSGDVETGKTVLRNFVNATVGFTKLGQAMHRSPKSLMRMLGPTGNPHAKNLFEMVAFLQRHERIRFKVQSSSAAA